VNAAYDGVIKRIGHNGVIIEHRFMHWTKLDDDTPSTKTWHSVYTNMNTNMSAGDKVSSGHEIGQLSSSSYDQPFLHFEVKIGSVEVFQNFIHYYLARRCMALNLIDRK